MGGGKHFVNIVNYMNSTYYKLSYKTNLKGEVHFYVEDIRIRNEIYNFNRTYVKVFTKKRAYLFNVRDYENKKLDLLHK